ncbi:MAG: 4-(cytidine 5'-diphospho)-2-C-methyl-D-erythritol kinase [Hyphomicrobiaceae bacterium]
MVRRAKTDDERAMPIREFAAAKINLTLEVLGRRSDGYHELISFVAFARDVGDWLTLAPGPAPNVETFGPEAIAIDGANLVMTVVEAMQRADPMLLAGTFRLEKYLPVAAGVGGGSADAAAAIRAIARLNNVTDAEIAFAALAAGIGADIPVCIGGNGQQAAIMSGIGERVWRPAQGALLAPGDLAAVLVNPRVPVPTAGVFAALAAPKQASAPKAQRLAPFASASACLAYIAASRNDLEVPAITIAPVIADVLGALRRLPACRLARMSGSGATCFGLFEKIEEARSAAAALRRAHPDWWIEATRLT